jgi:hypothetical protein
MWNTQLRQFWNARDAYIDGADSYAPSIGQLELRWDNLGGTGWYTVGSDEWALTGAPFSMINEWHLPSEYAIGVGATTGSGDPAYSVPAWSWVEDPELYAHVDAGESYSGYGGGIASEDMMYVANASAVWGHGAGLYFTFRVVSTEELVEGDLTWSMPAYGAGHAEAGQYDVLWASAGDEGRLGDFDDDGDIDADDIDALGAAIQAGSTDAEFDMDGDGDVDADDFAMHVTTLVDTALGEGTGTAFGDFNLDGLVGILDLGLLGDGYNSTNGWANGDANGDGTVGILDLGLLGDNYGYDGSVVPEPATLSLLGLGAVALIRRKK